MHFGDTIFIFLLALVVFGPKKLPEIGRQIGKLMVEFRRASNDFKLQIEEELRASEQAERQKALAAQAAAAVPVATEPSILPPSEGSPVNQSTGFDGPYAESGGATTVDAADLVASATSESATTEHRVADGDEVPMPDTEAPVRELPVSPNAERYHVNGSVEAKSDLPSQEQATIHHA